MTSERKRVVVTRPEPPSDEPPAKPKPKEKLSPEEIRALLAVTTTTRTPLRRAARRGLLAFIPTTILSVVLDSLIGWWSIPVLLVLSVAWVVWPLLRQSREGWT